MPFQKGNAGGPGKPKGSKHQKTTQWEALAESITGSQAEKFQNYLNGLWDSKDPKKQAIAAELFIKTVEYFKPKQQRTLIESDEEMVIRIVHE